MSTVFLNGQFIPAERAAIAVTNRAFRYGDGCFEAIRVMNGKPVFWKEHLERLSGTLMTLEIEPAFDFGQLHDWVRELLSRNRIIAGGMLRIMVFRKDGGTYFPLSNEAEVFMEVKPLAENEYAINAVGKKGAIFSRFFLPAHVLGNHKTLNKTIHVAASVFCQKNALDDAVILNHESEIAEVISSNIYLVMNDRIATPPLESGCLNGTIRKIMVKNASLLSLPLVEEHVPLASLEAAGEVWTSNAGSALQWFKNIGSNTYKGVLVHEAQARITEMALNSA